MRVNHVLTPNKPPSDNDAHPVPGLIPLILSIGASASFEQFPMELNARFTCTKVSRSGKYHCFSL